MEAPIEPANTIDNWQAFDEFMTNHLDLITRQKKGYNAQLHREAVAAFGEAVPVETVFRHIVSFYRDLKGIERQYNDNKHYVPTGRKRKARAATPETTMPQTEL